MFDIFLKLIFKLELNSFSNTFSSTKIFETSSYYFSQVSFKWKKNSNRRVLSRNGILQSVSKFKNYFIKNKNISNLDNLSVWGSSEFIENKIVIKNSRKIEDRRYKDFYIVVFAFPKNGIIFNSEEININDLIAHNAKKHVSMHSSERKKFLQKLGLKDLELLWNISSEKEKINLNNVLADVNPIEYQKNLNFVYQLKKNKITNLNFLPSTKFVVTKYLKSNKLNELQQLTFQSSVCSHDKDFLTNLNKYKIFVFDKNILNLESNFTKYVRLCNGFLSFSNKLVHIKKDNFKAIEKKFMSGNVNEIKSITKSLEEYVIRNPLKFKAWNYLSAIMRYNKDFERAHIISRIEIGIALTNKNKMQYLEALKSYAKSRIKINKELNKYQTHFIKNI